MGTCNFWTMKNFNLYAFVLDYDQQDADIIDLLYDDFRSAVDTALEELNEKLIFHKAITKAGYYEGFQIYVECEHELDKYKDYDDDDCYYYFDMSREEAYKSFFEEITYINNQLAEIAENNCMTKLNVVGTFNDGTQWYVAA